MRQRQVFLLVLAFIASAILAACGGAPAPSSSGAGNATAPAPAAATSAPAATSALAAATSAPATSTEATAAPAGEQATIRVMTFFAYDNPEVEQSVVDAFQKAHPNIKVQFELTSYNDIYKKYTTEVAGGTAPDVISMNFENLRSYATKGALAPLTDYVARDKLDTGIYYPNTLEMHTVDNVLYGLPATFSDNVLFYNKTMFDKADIAYPDASWDWNKLLEVGKKLTTDENGDGAIDTYGYGPAWWPMYLFLFDANVLTPDNSKCGLTTPEGLQAMKAYVGLFSKDGIAADAAAQKAQSAYDRFVAGKEAMFVAGPWAVKPFNDAIKDFEWDIAHHPKGTTQGTFLYSNSYAISASSKQKDAAWEFIKFASGVEGVTLRQKGQFEIAAVKSVADSIFVDSMKGKSPAHPEIFMEATSYGKRLPDHARFQEIMDAIQPELDLALASEASVEDAMTAACTAVDDLLKSQ